MNQSLFLIFEEDLANRFKFFEEETKIPVHQFSLMNVYHDSKFRTILTRLSFRDQLTDEYEKVKKKLSGLERIFISNSEGFLAKNIIFYIKQDFPHLKIITLQHGVFELPEPNGFQKLIKKTLNFISKNILGYYLLGDGFGEKSSDKYIVYNSIYKDYLIEHGWNADDVTISSYLLRGEKPAEKIENRQTKNAIFFLQCLNKNGMCSKETEIELTMDVLERLSKSYEKVFIKQHPFGDVELPKLPKNAFIVDVLPPLKDLSLAVSFFSTAILEYEKYGIKGLSLKSSRISIDPSIYDQFIYICDIDKPSDELTFYENEKRKGLKVFFEIGQTNLEQL